MEPKRELTNWIDSWKEFMGNSEAPPLYNEWCAVSMLASALERKCFLQWDKKIYPNFFIILVGDAGCRKGTAMSPARTLLETININIAADTTTKEKLVSRLEEAGLTTSYEDAEGNIKPYAAMTIFSEEFTVFLGYNNMDLMQWLADWYDCKDIWKYETKHQNSNSIEGLWVNLIGATTPELLQGTLPRESFGGGLNSRIIYVFAAPSEVKLVVFPHHQKQNQELKLKLERDLEVLRMYSGEFIPTKSYEACWAEWYPQAKDIALSNDRRMAGYMNRRGTHLHKLAMIMNVSRQGGLQLTDVDFNNALDLLERTERVMQKTFDGIGTSNMAAIMSNIINMLRVKQALKYSELLRHFYFDATDAEFGAAIATLDRAKLIEIRRSRESVEAAKDPMIVYIKQKVDTNPTINL